MAAWYKQAARDYDWACAGGTAEMAVWLQLLEQESLQPADGPEAEAIISTLLDLVKCFEKVRLHHVWTWGLYWKVPRRLLRMICLTYSMARRILYRNSYSSAVSTVTAIVPGSVFAIATLHMVLLYPCDQVVHRWPVRLCKYVDDLTISCKARAKRSSRDRGRGIGLALWLLGGRTAAGGQQRQRCEEG